MHKLKFSQKVLYCSAFYISALNQVQAQVAPLSCGMQMMLTGMTALHRDKGVPREGAPIVTSKTGELTQKEIKTILDRVYVSGKNQTPDQIKDDVYKRCENGR